MRPNVRVLKINLIKKIIPFSALISFGHKIQTPLPNFPFISPTEILFLTFPFFPLRPNFLHWPPKRRREKENGWIDRGRAGRRRRQRRGRGGAGAADANEENEKTFLRPFRLSPMCCFPSMGLKFQLLSSVKPSFLPPRVKGCNLGIARYIGKERVALHPANRRRCCAAASFLFRPFSSFAGFSIFPKSPDREKKERN